MYANSSRRGLRGHRREGRGVGSVPHVVSPSQADDQGPQGGGEGGEGFDGDYPPPTCTKCWQEAPWGLQMVRLQCSGCACPTDVIAFVPPC